MAGDSGIGACGLKPKDDRPVLKVKRIAETAKLPEYAHEGDSGLDVFSTVEMTIESGGSMLVPTGLILELPAGYEAQVRPRSGLALKHQVTVLNTPGTLDNQYRGQVGVILINHGKNPFVVAQGMKIAQIVVAPVTTVVVEEVKEVGSSDRGAGGFGSTGF